MSLTNAQLLDALNGAIRSADTGGNTSAADVRSFLTILLSHLQDNQDAVAAQLATQQQQHTQQLAGVVHLSGDEAIGGAKAFTSPVAVTTEAGNGLSVTVNGGNLYTAVAQFLSPHNPGAIFLAIGQQLPGSALFGYDAGKAFFTTYGRPASDFTISNATGFVGIGTANGSQKLTVVDGVSEIRIGSGAAGQTPTVMVMNQNGKAAGLFAGTNYTGFSFSDDAFFAIGAQPRAGFLNNTVADGSTTPFLCVYATGVGIGTGFNRPTEALEVVGNVKATSFIGNGSQLTKLPSDATKADVVGGKIPASQLPTRDPYALQDNTDVAHAVVGGTYANGELLSSSTDYAKATSAQVAAGDRIVSTGYIYEYCRTAAGPLGWVRWPKG